MHYSGLLYRALNPSFARTPLSGEGASKYGGRYNPPGMPALYTSQSIVTAIREANQIGTLQPTTLVAYEADLNPIFDAASTSALASYGLTQSDIATDDWRMVMRTAGKAPTQELAIQLKADGYAGMQVRSFANGATALDLNLVLWIWSADLPTK